MKITEKLGLKKPEPSDTFDIQDLNDNADILDKLWEIVYPVGAIYMSASAVSPQDLFGGTWVKIEDRFLLSAGDSYVAGDMGGAATHTLTVDEIPSHDGHLYSNTNSTIGGTAGYYLASSTLTSYGSYGRGWSIHDGNEAHPAGFNKGGGAAHNNMPPYLVVYMWERTA